ncbi:N-acetylglutaminylglutamine synthetase [soil metagenome]
MATKSSAGSDTGSEAGVTLDCGWGRLIFAHTFPDPASVANALLEEKEAQRDIALYLNSPHIVLSKAPQQLFLDPSNTFRLKFENYSPRPDTPSGFTIAPLRERAELDEVNRIYQTTSMVPVDPDHVWAHRHDERFFYALARHDTTGAILGVANGVDHVKAFQDIGNGSSLWALAVDPQADLPGVGEALTRYLVEFYQGRGRQYLDLSVMHDNEVATRLYEKLGFDKIPVFAIKRTNQINEKLYIGTPPHEGYNPYSHIIIDEALRRGITVDPIDPPRGYFTLKLGGRHIICRESLSELTSAIAMSRCDDKQLTRHLLAEHGLLVPAQRPAGTPEDNNTFLAQHRTLVVKPARGEQGTGISVGIEDPDDLPAAIAAAAQVCDTVLLEAYHLGQDLRIIVINSEVVAAAVRRPAEIVSTGRHSIRQLIGKLSRRRAAATGGESSIPLDDETDRCVRNAGYSLDDTPAEGVALQIRKTANLHTGGTIHDVTAQLHPVLADAAVRAARALAIPFTGLDLIVKSPDFPEYVIIEANERPGLANHEPQPTAEKFIDFLFPVTILPR